MTKRRLRALKALLVFVSTLFVVGQSTADDTGLLAKSNFSGTATITSDYVFRGLSQTGEDPAVQASFDYKHPSGVFLGAWASNVDETISAGNAEIDLYAGYRNQLFENLSYELSIIYYWYPGGGPGLDYVELHGGLNYAFANLPLEPNVGVGFNYSPDFYGEDGNAYYYSGTLRLTLPYSFGLGFEVGYQNVEGGKTTGPGTSRGLNGGDGYDYLFWKIGLSKEVLGFNLDVSYYDTNEEEYFRPIGDSRFVFSISRSF